MRARKLVARILAFAMAVSVVSGTSFVSDISVAAAKAPKLSASKKTLEAGKSFTLKVKKNGAKITGSKWKTGKKSVAAISKAKKTSVKVTAKAAGTTKIKCTLNYKLGNKKVKKKLNCKVTVSSTESKTDNPDVVVITETKKPVDVTQPDTNDNQTEATAVPDENQPVVVPTESPSPKPDYFKYDYFAIFDESKNTTNDNFYVNFVLSDSWSTNTKLSAIQSLDLQIDSEESFDIDLYVSAWDCEVSKATKIATIKTDGTEGQKIKLTSQINGNSAIRALDSKNDGRISFGFKPAKDSGRFILHDMYVNYNDSNLSSQAHHKAAISVVTCSLGKVTAKYNSDKAANNNLASTLDDYVKEAPEGLFITRPKDASDAINDYESMAKITEKKGYKFGTCVTYNLIKNDPEFCKLLAHHCDSITAMNEFKAYSLLDEKATLAAYKNDNESMPVMNYEKADFLCKWAQDNGLQIRGHALVWDNSMESNHKWFFTQGFKQNGTYASNDICRKRLKYYVEQVMTHFQKEYPDVVYCWDVVNEGVDEGSSDRLKIRQSRGGANPFYYHCSSGANGSGENYVKFTFQCAYDTREQMIKDGILDDKKKIELVYNDYNVIEDGKRPYVKALVQELNSGSVQLVDSVGCQGYLGAYQRQQGCLEQSWVDKTTKTIKEFANMSPSVHVQLTEMAMRNFEWSRLPEHGDFAARLFNGLANINEETNNSFTSMSIWAFIDDPIMNKVDESFDYWQYAPFSGMFDDVYRVKPAFINAYEILSK